MARPKKPWSKTVEEAGVAVRLFERDSTIYRDVRLEGGRRDKKSLGHGDRTVAVEQARSLALRIAELRMTGLTSALTLGQMVRFYLAHHAPTLSDKRQRIARDMYAPYFLAYLGDSFVLDDLSQSHIDGYAQARRSGAVRSKRHRGVMTPPRDGTIRNELNWFKAAARWARGHKVSGRRLLAADPFDGLTLPQERNVRRPVASEDRFQKSLAVADAIDPAGRLHCMLHLARYTGRRVNAICQLRAEDVFLTRDQAARALAAAGMDEGQADHMPHGALRWSDAHDKLGYLELTAISAPARAAIERYLRKQPRLGSAPLFPDLKRAGQPITRAAADHLLRAAEERAKLPKFDRGLWHPYRRAWASSRKHLPDVDVRRAGGWRDLATMKQSYQQADPATMLRAIENEPVRPTEGPVVKRSADGGTT